MAMNVTPSAHTATGQRTWDGNLTGVWASSTALSLVLMFCTIALFMPDIKGVALTLLCGSLGALVGWSIGTFISPYKDEIETFSGVWTVVSGVLSGVVLTKVYDFVTDVLTGRHPLDFNIKCRIGISAGWLVLFALHTFLTRHYSARLGGLNPVVVNPAAMVKDKEIAAAGRNVATGPAGQSD